jgi:hypothetical protein
VKLSNDQAVNFSLGNFFEIKNFNNLYHGIKKSLQTEQKELVLGRKNKEETDSYFNFLKFLFSSPDKAL